MRDSIFIYGNLLEALLWAAIGTWCALAACWRRRRAAMPNRLLLLAAATFVAFGLSDVVEVQTGAWWRPWWLLVWKAVCVGVLLALAVRHYRNSRRAPGQ